ncbi:MAG: class I SAM-dependent methyltransferase [Methanomassiliicoccus sp.]|nr:class I SAM-dependent methyltransferase [Methanomassiliicoccus sp.]
MREDNEQQKRWDKAYGGSEDFFGKLPSELAVNALGALRKNNAKRMLELGCGQGRDTWFFAHNGLEVVALDYSESGICQMRKKAQDLGAKVTVRVHDARQPLPFPDDYFDAIYSHMFFTMEFSEDEVAAILCDCLRVLRPGGLNIYSVRNDHDAQYGKFEPRGKDMWENPLGFVVHFFTEEKVRRLAGGYELVSIREFEDPSPPMPKKLYEVVLRKPE